MAEEQESAQDIWMDDQTLTSYVGQLMELLNFGKFPVPFRFFPDEYYEEEEPGIIKDSHDLPVIVQGFNLLFAAVDAQYREECDSLGLVWRRSDEGLYEIMPASELSEEELESGILNEEDEEEPQKE